MNMTLDMVFWKQIPIPKIKHKYFPKNIIMITTLVIIQVRPLATKHLELIKTIFYNVLEKVNMLSKKGSY